MSNTSYEQVNRIVESFLNQAKYIREEGKGKPGDKDYKPALWYWITPSGEKKLVDQYSVGV